MRTDWLLRFLHVDRGQSADLGVGETQPAETANHLHAVLWRAPKVPAVILQAGLSHPQALRKLDPGRHRALI